MLYEVPTLSIPAAACKRFADLKRGEEYRVIGGDRGDVFFYGFTVEAGRTFLYKPQLETDYADLDEDEVQAIAEDTVDFAFRALGAECVEH